MTGFLLPFLLTTLLMGRNKSRPFTDSSYILKGFEYETIAGLVVLFISVIGHGVGYRRPFVKSRGRLTEQADE
jgi:hypothetical protein